MTKQYVVYESITKELLDTVTGCTPPAWDKKDHRRNPVVFCYMHKSGYAPGMCSNGA